MDETSEKDANQESFLAAEPAIVRCSKPVRKFSPMTRRQKRRRTFIDNG
jgi:hypothetical protein